MKTKKNWNFEKFCIFKGCLPQFVEWIDIRVAAVSIVGIAVGVIQIVGICFACCLSKNILKDYDDYYYWH